MPATQVAFLAGAAASLLFSLSAMALALREPGLRWKPFWAILALVGVGGGALVLARPDEVYWFFGIALPTASFTTAGGGWQPQTVQLLFPVGAILALLRVARHRTGARSAAH